MESLPSVSLRSFISTRVASLSSFSFLASLVLDPAIFLFFTFEKKEKHASDGFNLVQVVQVMFLLNLLGFFQGSWMTRAVEDLIVCHSFRHGGGVHKKIVVIGQRVTLFISFTKVRREFPWRELVANARK